MLLSSFLISKIVFAFALEERYRYTFALIVHLPDCARVLGLQLEIGMDPHISGEADFGYFYP
jgi:hypothetical protein